MIPLHEGAGLAEVGGKAHGLTLMVRAGLPIPEGWVLPAAMLEQHVAALSLSDLARQVQEELKSGDWVGPARQIRSAILREDLPAQVAREVSAVSGRLAVRSSATCESLPGASFAGQFQSFLDVEDAEQASAAIRSCWASLWSVPALRYRATAPPSSIPPGMAVLVQRFVAASISGTATVQEERVDVEATWGLGSSVMSGLVVPDRYSFDAAGQLVTHAAGFKNVRAGAAGGNLTWRRIRGDERAQATLTEAEAREVVQVALRAAAVTGQPVEIEWLFEGDRIWLVQARRTDGEARLAARIPFVARRSGLHGIPAAPGQVVGRVRIVKRAEDLEEVEADEIVVTHYASASIANAFRGAGLITEMGGSSGHGATLARERQLPMVTGVLRATRDLKDGQLVRLDGLNGAVEVLPQEPPEQAS